MRRLYVIICISLLAFVAVVNAAARSAAPQGDQAVKTMQADFVQTKTMKMLGDKMVSRGKMYYQNPDKLHWEYTAPYAYTFVLSGNKVMLKKGTRKDIVDVKQNRIFREIARIMVGSVCVTSTSATKEMKMSKEMKSMYKRIVLHFDTKTTLVKKVVMYEKNGDTTEIEIKNVTLNKNISPAVFNVQ